MKYLILLALIPIGAWANQSGHTYTWHRYSDGKDEVLKFKVSGKNESDSLADAAFFCVDFFEKKHKLSVDERVDLIDICVNPKEEK